MDRQVEIYDTVLCIPKSANYDIRSVDRDSIQFEEVRWVDGKRASLDEFNAHRRGNKGGNDVSVAAITWISSFARQDELEHVVRAAVLDHQEDFLQASPISFQVKSWCGRQTFQFMPHSDGVFVAAVDSEVTFFCADKEHWIAATSYSGIDVLLRCVQFQDGEYACNGGFDAGNAHVRVSLFGKSALHLVSAYRENRSLVLSFVSK